MRVAWPCARELVEVDRLEPEDWRLAEGAGCGLAGVSFSFAGCAWRLVDRRRVLGVDVEDDAT